MSAMGFQKNVDEGRVGGVTSIQFYFVGFLEFVNFAKPLRQTAVSLRFL